MPRYTRREVAGLLVAGALLQRRPPTIDSTVAGVRLGVQSYSFRDLPRAPGGDAIDAVVKACVEVGLGDCELWAPQVEPLFQGSTGRGDLRAWRLRTPLDYFRDVGRRFAAAGVDIFAYNYSVDDSFTDSEIDRGFEMAKALGVGVVTTSTTLAVARRIVPFAERHRLIVAVHGHSDASAPNEFASPVSFETALRMSRYFRINLDIGHFTAANYDAVAFIRQHHDRITNLHLKDRRRNQGDNVPWGQGDTPIREVLQLLRANRWPIRAHVEYEYAGRQSPIDEVKACAAYARRALTS